MGANHQVVVLHREVVHGDCRQVQLQGTPCRAVVCREHHPALGAEIELAAPGGIFAHDVEVHVGRKAGMKGLPRVAIVGGLVDIRAVVVQPVIVEDDVGRRRVERGRFDDADRAKTRRARDPPGDVVPRLAGVACQLNPAIVAARPDQALLLR